MKYTILASNRTMHTQHGDLTGYTFEVTKRINELFFGHVMIPHDTGFIPVWMSIFMEDLKPC